MAETLRPIRAASRGSYTMIRCPTTFFLLALLCLPLVALSLPIVFFSLAAFWSTYYPDMSFGRGLD